MNDRNPNPEFNEQNEQAAMQNRARDEHHQNPEQFSKTKNDLSLGNSIRNEGDVNGSTFGADSNPARFSNLGQKNNVRKEEGPNDGEDRLNS